MLRLTGCPHRSGCHGWILYTQPESERNSWYIDFYKSACQRYGMSIELGIYNNTIYDHTILPWAEAGCQLRQLVKQEQPVFVINRTRDYHLAEFLEQLNIHVYNPSQTAELGNHKAKACRYMQQHGIPVMPSVYGIDKTTKDMPMDVPFIIKSYSGHGGTEVFFINNMQEWEDWICRCCSQRTEYLAQQPASDLGKDVRVYVVGNQIAAAVLRTSQNDFRSNSCLGGTAQLYQLTKTERHLVEQAISGLQIGMAGIDFIFHHGQMVFNEIEDMAGARNLYALTDYDIADEYVRFIKKDSSNIL